MQISIVGRHLKMTEPIKKYIDKRLIRLEKYDRKIVEARAIVSVEKFRHIVEITVLTKHFSVIGKGQSNDVYTSVDEALDRVEKQLKKHQERIKEHLGKRTMPMRVAVGVQVMEEETPKKSKVVRRKSFAAKPMSVEEAKAEIEVSKEKNFLVFRNSGTDKVNVLYRQADGNLGLIEEP